MDDIEIIDDELFDQMYSEAEAYCFLNNIDCDSITYDELYQCAITVASVLDLEESDVIEHLQRYWNCFE